MPSPAVAVIARWEWVRRWRSLLAIGVVGGLLSGLVVAGVVLARRTTSAPERLFAAVAPGDLHLRVFRHDVADQAVARPEVSDSWVAGLAVGRIEGAPTLHYSGVSAPISPDGSLVRPVVVKGRASDPSDPAEVVMTESVAEASGFTVGDRITLAMLSAEEVLQFDTGFGEPDGPTLDLTVVGIVRVPPGLFDGSPIVATPAFAAAHADLFTALDVRVRLRPGADPGDYVDAVTALVDNEGTSGTEDFTPLEVARPRDGTADLVHSSRVLFAGLIAAVSVAGLAVFAAMAEVWSRHHGAARPTQRVEAALGLPAGQRVMARAIPASVSSVVAGLVAALVGAGASWIEPVGSLWRVEPQPGGRFDGLAVGSGGLGVTGTMLGLACLTAWRAGRNDGDAVVASRGRHLGLVPTRRGWLLAGAAFALGGDGRRRVPARMSLIACVAGIGGVVASLTFSASLDRLVNTPQRWGWNADFVIADIDDAVLAELLDDPRLAAVSDVYSGTVVIDGRMTDGQAVRHRLGDTGWVLQRGRLPVAAGEVVLGGKLASQIDARIGDQVTVADAVYTVVGVGLGPNTSSQPFGTTALFSYEGLKVVAATNFFREGLVRVAPGQDVDEVLNTYGQYEVAARSVPAAVRDVSELGPLPVLLGAFLVGLAAVALVHALVLTIDGRARDLAVLRALGATPGQSGLAVVAMALTFAVVGVVGGLPLGLAVARLLWGEVGRSIGISTDVAVPAHLLVVPAAALLGAAALAVLPASKVARQDTAAALRSN